MMATRRIVIGATLLATVALYAAACGESPTGPIDEGFPALLSGLNVDAPEATFYVPTWELWTNGSVKTRKVWLQDGGTVDISARALWQFPDGTRFTKTFSYFTQASPNTLVPIETRIIRRRAGQWETAVYLWRADGSDAELLDGSAPTPVPVVDAQGRSFTHQIPSLSQCQVCHGLNPTFIIGFSELDLNSTLPGENATQLDRFASSGFFNSAAPASPTEIVAPDATTLAVLGYVQGNCRHCHNQNSSLNLNPETFLQNTVNQNGPSGVPLITPQDPDASLIYQRFNSGSMPALGVQLADSAARNLMRDWILTHNFQ